MKLHVSCCKTCPSETGIESFVGGLPPCTDPPDEVTFKLWVTVDPCSLITMMLAFDDYLSSLAQDLFAHSRHHYIANCQATFFKDLKTHLEAEEEGLCWELHFVPLMESYFCSPDGELLLFP